MMGSVRRAGLRSNLESKRGIKKPRAGSAGFTGRVKKSLLCFRGGFLEAKDAVTLFPLAAFFK
jgi:hypothetical protein